MKSSRTFVFTAFLAAGIFCTPIRAEVSSTPTSGPSDSATSKLASEPVHVIEQTQDKEGTVVARLSNGMRVIVKAVHTAPVVSVRAYVRAGGLYEGQWLGGGISHLVEHLVAKYSISGETPGHMRSKTKAAVSRLDKIGGQANAYTSHDHTCYYISAVASKTENCIALIADQLARPNITRDDFQREHGVVQRELEMGHDDPDRVAYYTHQENLYQDHPAGVPVIGYARPLSRLKYEDVLAYHRQMYVPQNIIFTVVGDLHPQKALDGVVRNMQGFQKGRQPQFTLPKVPKLCGLRRVVCPNKAFRETAQLMSFQTIPLMDPDLYPLDVLSTILSRGESSRLVKRLKFEKRLVTSIDSWSHTPSWGRGSFTITFRAKPENADPAETAILDELRKVIAKGVNEKELARAKRQMVADYVRQQQTTESIAATLGHDLLTTCDLSFSKNYTKNIQKVTAEQVQAVAKKYFHFEDQAITRIVPISAARNELHAAAKNDTTREQVYTLPNGLRVVLRPTKAVGLTAMTLAARGGLLLETPETNGLGSLMMSLSTRGAGKHSAQDLASFFNAAGGSIHGLCGDNSFLYQASVLTDDFAPALEMFADVVLEPTFAQKELDSVRPLAEAAIHRQDEHWQSQLNKVFRAKFFTGSPWRMLSQGRRAVIEQATPETLKQYHRRSLHAGGSALAIYGNFDPAQAKAIIAKRFGAMPNGKPKPLPSVRRVVASTGETHVLKTHTRQAGVIVAAPSSTISDSENRLPLMLLDTIISGYRLPNGWLHKELRGKKLVYVVHAYQKLGFLPGAFVVLAGTQPDKAPEVVEIIRANLRKAAGYLPTRAELDRAINTIMTSEILDNQTVDALACNTALNVMYGLGADWPRTLEAKLKAVTPEQVRAAARKYLNAGLVVTVITPKPELFPAETLVQAEKQAEKVE